MSNPDFDNIKKRMEKYSARAKEACDKTDIYLVVKDLNNAEKCAEISTNFAYRALLLYQKYISQYPNNKKEDMKKIADDAKKWSLRARHMIMLSKLSPSVLMEKLNTIFRFGFGFSVILIFYYCFLVINYYPTGLSLTDSVGIIFIILGYTSILGVIFLFGYFIYLFWFILMGKFKKLFISITIIIIFAILAFNFEGKDLFFLAGLAVIPFFLLNIRKEVDSDFYISSYDSIFIRFMYFMVILFFVAVIESKSSITPFSTTLRIFGIRQEKAIIRLEKEEDYKFIKEIALVTNSPLITGCRKKDENRILFNVDILWNKLGENIYIELPKNKNAIENRLEIKQADAKIITENQNKKSIVEGCFSINSPELFESGKNKTKNKSWLESHLVWLESLPEGYEVTKIYIIGYSDISKYSKGNTLLSKERAETIKKIFEEYLKSKNKELYEKYKEKIEIIGDGNRNSSTECQNKFSSKEDIDNCQSIDRKITIEYNLKYDPNHKSYSFLNGI